MAQSEIRGELLAAIEDFEIIDCHEHLPPEAVRIDMPVDFFTLVSVCNYEYRDLALAGMPEADRLALPDQRIPEQRRWEMLAPYWERIRHGSYARAVALAVRRFYGVERIDGNTCHVISERMRAANVPGLYRRVLQDACHIRTALTIRPQGEPTATGSPLLTPLGILAYDMESWASIQHPQFLPQATVRSLDDYVDALEQYIVSAKRDGAVGLKMVVGPLDEPDRNEALSAFEDLRSGHLDRLPSANPLRAYVMDRAMAMAASHDLTVATHTGYWDDFRQLHPLHLIPVLQRHPDTRFDVYHLGYPFVRDTLMLAKGFANVWLNFCWTHIISQRFATAALDEAVDLVPTNKILGFGGDYLRGVEKVYGHLVMAREDIATVLAVRVSEGRMTVEEAVDIAHQWLWDNPVTLYGLAE